MSKEKWSDATTKRFISCYIQQSSLWNISDPDYALKAKVNNYRKIILKRAHFTVYMNLFCLQKEMGYKTLQEEFGLTLTEVKNKIRIYRTTYGQELKKMETSNVFPKLSWFRELHKAFNQGKIKSFTKTPSKKSKSPVKEKLIEIDYQEEDTGEISEDDEKMEEQEFDNNKVGKQETEEHQIIIEPYEEEYDEEEYRQEPADPRQIVKTESLTKANHNSSSPASTSAFSGTGILSNELFLKSLQATLDRLPDAKNMRARIKIQEVLYKIAYEIEK